MTVQGAELVLQLPRVYNDDTVSPGWLGLVVFLALAAGTFLLLRSMFRHLRRVPPSFDNPGSEPDARPQQGDARSDEHPPGAPSAS